MPSALISGASIAGPALAFWLSKSGFDVTIVERSSGFRTGGQAIDIRGPALSVVEKMGLLPAVVDLRTHHKGMSVVDADGREISRTTERTASAGRLNSGDIEIFRDDFSRLLVDASKAAVEYRFGDSVTKIDAGEDGVSVTFESAPPRDFDIVVGADGLHSRIRRLAFESNARAVYPLGIGFAIFTAPNILGLEDWQLSFRDETSGYVVYPSLDNTNLRVNLGFALAPEEYPQGDPEAQGTLIQQRCSHLRGAIPDLLKHLNRESDLWFGPLAQVKMPGWSNGRVSLVGDAAYCPSPFTGQGTSLALIGAYVLAKELENSRQEPETAFARYEQRMRPFVEMNQALLNLARQGPAPDDEFYRAKNGIDLGAYA
jgi:2-polyprenyl-6-methoxyphenol hydroxylase-like FAD-dependent oxidoreductase